eukprot:TRINITY_DN1450_c0_g1_i2.p2 TRINITY_DN1450_c0_g1~~TRINITY_DN1450_c0_g1_i2.p2  ORF type:complete len:215 (+),score=-3.44 TRINITY_DN1450_c0_g1_i2:660-1304(+)
MYQLVICLQGQTFDYKLQICVLKIIILLQFLFASADLLCYLYESILQALVQSCRSTRDLLLVLVPLALVLCLDLSQVIIFIFCLYVFWLQIIWENYIAVTFDFIFYTCTNTPKKIDLGFLSTVNLYKMDQFYNIVFLRDCCTSQISIINKLRRKFTLPIRLSLGDQLKKFCQQYKFIINRQLYLTVVEAYFISSCKQQNDCFLEQEVNENPLSK